MNTAQLPSSLTPSVKPQVKPSKNQRIAAIQADAKKRTREIELEIFKVWDSMLRHGFQAADAEHKVWLLQDDIKHIRETMYLDIRRIKEE